MLLVLLPSSLVAQVINSADNGFTIEIEKHVAVDHKAAYAQFIKINEWWIADHTWFGRAENLNIEEIVGGCFCEIAGDKQALHMTVSFVNPNREVRMIGGLGPLQMMGVNGGMSWKFEQLKDGTTKIIHHYQVSGYAKGGLGKLATIVDSVQSSQVEALVAKLSSH